jgi:hypothetical protein
MHIRSYSSKYLPTSIFVEAGKSKYAHSGGSVRLFSGISKTLSSGHISIFSSRVDTGRKSGKISIQSGNLNGGSHEYASPLKLSTGKAMVGGRDTGLEIVIAESKTSGGGIILNAGAGKKVGGSQFLISGEGLKARSGNVGIATQSAQLSTGTLNIEQSPANNAGLTNNDNTLSTGYASSSSGYLNLRSGLSDNGVGGNVNLIAGSATSNTGGSIYITSGNSTNTVSGSLFVFFWRWY